MKRRWLPQWVSEYRDRHGKPRYRFRRKGYATYHFAALPGTAAFMAEYRDCCDGKTATRIEPGRDRPIPGSIDDLCARYYRSPAWLGIPSESTKRTYRGVIERFRAKHGDKPVRRIKVNHLDAIFGSMAQTPAAANNLRKLIKRLFRYAVKIDMIKTDPAILTDRFKAKSTGFHTWTESEIAQFEAYHPPGTKAGLAMALLLYTGQRRSDVIVMGRQHIQDGRLRIRQLKTGKNLKIPIHSKLRQAIDAMPPGQMTFLETAYGKPFSAAGFGNWFRDRCNEAGLPHCTSHGLRKAMSRRIAEGGLSHSVGKSITGHDTDQEYSNYAAAADQSALADIAMANLETRFAKKSAKSLKKGENK